LFEDRIEVAEIEEMFPQAGQGNVATKFGAAFIGSSPQTAAKERLRLEIVLRWAGVACMPRALKKSSHLAVRFGAAGLCNNLHNGRRWHARIGAQNRRS